MENIVRVPIYIYTSGETEKTRKTFFLFNALAALFIHTYLALALRSSSRKKGKNRLSLCFQICMRAKERERERAAYGDSCIYISSSPTDWTRCLFWPMFRFICVLVAMVMRKIKEKRKRYIVCNNVFQQDVNDFGGLNGWKNNLRF